MEDKQLEVGEVTFDQALALVEQMIDWIDFSEDNSAPRSPHVLAHLEAVLGSRNLPQIYGPYQSLKDCASQVEGARRNAFHYRSIAAERIAGSHAPEFASYFKGCIAVLCAKLGIPVDMGTTFPAAEVTVERALAFVEAMTGTRIAEGMHDGYAVGLSPHCMTHFEAVLGRGCVPGPDYLIFHGRPSLDLTGDGLIQALAFLTYLARVVRALDDALALPAEEGPTSTEGGG